MTQGVLEKSTVAQTDVAEIVKKQRDYFNSGKTLDINFRLAQLKKLRQLIVDNEQAILDALYKDLHKSSFEAYGTEIGIVMGEIDHTIANLREWARPKRVSTPMFHAVGTSHIYHDPYGVVYIVAPWNYPFQLLIAPLVGAICAGNCSVLKPSEYSVHTSALCAKLLNENFDEGFVKVVEGGVEESKALLEQRFDYIFFTGGVEVGRYIYQQAAKFLTPVTLELGGKSPCLVDENLHLEYATKRIVWGKYTNAGQTCVAPDYLLVNEKIKDKVVAKMKEHVETFFGNDPQKSPDYGRIISKRHFNRLKEMIETSKGNVVIGGKTDAQELYISPTVIDNVELDDILMKDEIFGPLLPIVTYKNKEEALDKIRQFEKPLAFYIFSEDKDFTEYFLTNVSSGGGCVNDTLMHLGNVNLPFGGVGESGIGAYHGEDSFYTFSHKKSILKKSTLIDLKIRYAPYKNNLPILKKLIKYLN